MTDCFSFSSPYLFIFLIIMCWLGPLAHYDKENNNGDNGYLCIILDFNGLVFSFAVMYDAFCGLCVGSFCHIQEVSLHLLWLNFLDDKEMLNYMGGFFFLYGGVC